jgi:hypothetical protein
MSMRLGGLVHALIHSFEPGVWGYTERWVMEALASFSSLEDPLNICEYSYLF